MEYEEDNGNYPDEEWGNTDYQGGRPVRQVNFRENENDYASIELEFDDIECWDTDIEVGGYLSNNITSKECRDAERARAVDVLKRPRRRIRRENIKVEIGGRDNDFANI